MSEMTEVLKQNQRFIESLGGQVDRMVQRREAASANLSDKDVSSMMNSLPTLTTAELVNLMKFAKTADDKKRIQAEIDTKKATGREAGGRGAAGGLKLREAIAAYRRLGIPEAGARAAATRGLEPEVAEAGLAEPVLEPEARRLREANIRAYQALGLSREGAEAAANHGGEAA
jgi:phage-related tail protein